jgi:hypothetical protein
MSVAKQRATIATDISYGVILSAAAFTDAAEVSGFSLVKLFSTEPRR